MNYQYYTDMFCLSHDFHLNMQLPEILKSILLLQLDNEMPCFSPEDVIFITNKWDSLHTDEDSSDEDEENKVWENTKSNIKNRWPSVKEDHIFKLNLKDVIVVIFCKFT